MTAKVISGGELYHLRTLQDFRSAASYIRGRWPKAGISFGVFDVGMTPALLGQTLSNALTASDEVVWLYTEGFHALTLPLSDSWIQSIPRPADTSARKLIYHAHPGKSPTVTPDWVAANIYNLASAPFNGVTLYMRDPAMTLNATASINSSTPVSYDQLMSILAPIRNLDLGNLKRNYAFVLGNSPPDMWSQDWTVVIKNWANLARACKDSGLRGVFFDNENYGGTFGRTPATGDPMTYKVAARSLGLGIMLTMLSAFPDIEIIHAHGPYVSYADALTALGANPGWAAANDLLGPFCEGMISAIPDPVPIPPPGPLVDPPLTLPPPVNAWQRGDIDALVNSLSGIEDQLTRLNDTIDAALQRRNL